MDLCLHRHAHCILVRKGAKDRGKINLTGDRNYRSQAFCGPRWSRHTFSNGYFSVLVVTSLHDWNLSSFVTPEMHYYLPIQLFHYHCYVAIHPLNLYLILSQFSLIMCSPLFVYYNLCQFSMGVKTEAKQLSYKKPGRGVPLFGLNEIYSTFRFITNIPIQDHLPPYQLAILFSHFSPLENLKSNTMLCWPRLESITTRDPMLSSVQPAVNTSE